MSSLIGHSLGALTVWEAGRQLVSPWLPRRFRWYILPIIIAVLPDLDILLRGTGHRGMTHSLAAAILLALLGTGIVILLKRSLRFRRVFTLLFLCAMVHPLLDYLMGCGPPVTLFWPFSEQGWLSPVQLVPTAYYSSAGTTTGLESVLYYIETWRGVAWELASIGMLWLVFLIVSLSGFVVVWQIYN